MKQLLQKVLTEIQKANKENGSPIDNEESNEILIWIFDEFDLQDDEDFLINKFGIDGFNAIREAEQGVFPYDEEK